MNRVFVLFFVTACVTAFGFSKSRVLEEMEPIIADCIGRSDTTHPVFHGCWDWHSAVHGHWALFRLATALGRTSAHTWSAEKSLSPLELERERVYLARDLEFENPYGRAWFLRLAIDFERWADRQRAPKAARLRPIADLIADSIRKYFAKHPVSPGTVEYGNSSWAFYQLRAYLDFIGDGTGRADVDSVIESRFLVSPESHSFAESQTGFFSLFGNWSFLVVKTRTGAEVDGFLKVHPIRPKDLGVYPVTTSHSMGLTWSRAWAFSALARATGRKDLQTAFESHVEHGMKAHAKYKGDYRAYDHWIPQFAVYALTEDLD